jgi:hypothetical protein
MRTLSNIIIKLRKRANGIDERDRVHASQLFSSPGRENVIALMKDDFG